VVIRIGPAVLLLGEGPPATRLLGTFGALTGMVLVVNRLDAKATVIGFLVMIGAGMLVLGEA